MESGLLALRVRCVRWAVMAMVEYPEAPRACVKKGWKKKHCNKMQFWLARFIAGGLVNS